jgi:peptide deformylase
MIDETSIKKRNVMTKLPDYVVLNDPSQKDTAVLRKPAKALNFPLSEEDIEDVRLVEAKFDGAEKMAGLAAPQIGIGKQIIVFHVPDDPIFKKWRPDIVQTIPKSIWINPSYEPLSEEKTKAFEGCFSVKDLAGPVNRFYKIKYKAFTPDGKQVEGIAEGYMARVIQHEVDHLNGKCFIDIVPKEELLSMDDYMKMRQAAMAAQG